MTALSSRRHVRRRLDEVEFNAGFRFGYPAGERSAPAVVVHAAWCNAHFPDGVMREDVGFCCYEARVGEIVVNIDEGDGVRLENENHDKVLTPDQARQVAAERVRATEIWESSR